MHVMLGLLRLGLPVLEAASLLPRREKQVLLQLLQL